MILDLPSDPILKISTTENRGHSVEEIVEMCLDKIIYISDTAPAPIRDQAVAYRDNIRPLLVFYINKAVQSDRTTLYNELTRNGLVDAAKVIRRL
jgi:hypothetical protein